MTENNQLPPEEFLELPDPEVLKTREAAAKMLGRQPLSVRGLGEKLEKKGFSQEAIAKTLAWLVEMRYLNDEEYARLVIRSYTGRGYGPMRLRQELNRRGISRELTERLVAESPVDQEKIDAYIQKKLRGQVLDRKLQKRVADGLLRRGFSYEEVRRGLERWRSEETEEAESWENE